MGQEGSYDCDGLNNQNTKMVEWKFLKFKVWSVYLLFILFTSHAAGLRQIEMIFHIILFKILEKKYKEGIAFLGLSRPRFKRCLKIIKIFISSILEW